MSPCWPYSEQSGPIRIKTYCNVNECPYTKATVIWKQKGSVTVPPYQSLRPPYTSPDPPQVSSSVWLDGISGCCNPGDESQARRPQQNNEGQSNSRRVFLTAFEIKTSLCETERHWTFFIECKKQWRMCPLVFQLKEYKLGMLIQPTADACEH